MVVFEEVLKRLEAEGSRRPHQTSGHPTAARAKVANRAACAINTTSFPQGYFRDERNSAYKPTEVVDAPCHQEPTLETLQTAYSKVRKKLRNASNLDLAALRKIRKSYANEFHPDRVPADLKQLANRQLAEINACLDSAKATTGN